MKYIFILVAALLTAGLMHAQKVRHGELLCRPTDRDITVQMVFDDDAEVRIQYGEVSGNYTHATSWQSAAAGQFIQLKIDGLEPDTRYYYQVSHRLPGSASLTFRNEGFFHTARVPGSTFTFTVQADPHMDNQSDTAVYERCLQNQLADKPDFMIDLGDIIMTDKLKNSSNKVPFDTIPFRCRLMRKYYDQICHSVPLLLVLGNHEGESGWYTNGTGENIAVWNTNERKKYFPNPRPDGFYTGDVQEVPFVGQREAYYAWQWGDALFIVIDPYWNTMTKPDANTGWRWTLGKTQYDWLKITLENSTAKWKFVFGHQLVGGDPNGRGGIEFADKYEWGGNNLDGTPGWQANRPGWYKPIKDLLKEHRVNVFFHGHDHFFGKQEKDCLIYQECPQPSHPNYTNIAYAASYGYISGQILPNSGHLRITVSPDEVKTQYVRSYLPSAENSTRHNGDVSATYFIGPGSCYDTLSAGIAVLWNQEYKNEVIYPNPFSHETSISFTVAQPQRISLSISNAKGETVRTLLSGQPVGEGKYSVIWDGMGKNENTLPDGMYYYTLHGDRSLQASGTIVLMRK